MAKKSFKDEKDKRTKFVHLAFSEVEIEALDTYKNKSNTTRTEFVRQAIQEKIMRIEHPEMFNAKSSSTNGQNTKDIDEIKVEIVKMNKKLEVVSDIKNIFKILEKMEKQPKVNENEKIVIEILKEHTQLKPLKIMELSELASHEVYEVIKNERVFGLTTNGRVILKEDD